jgi:N-methylhydantoinase A
LRADASNQLAKEGCDRGSVIFGHQLELRYRGQSATISIKWSDGEAHEAKFHEAHEKASGLCLPHPVELVNIRLSARAPAALHSIDIYEKNQAGAVFGEIHMPELGAKAPINQRTGLTIGERFSGPLLLTESAATSWVKPGWAVEADEWGNLLLQTES